MSLPPSRGASSLSNKDALAVDARLVNNRHRVTWIFEGETSGPLLREAVHAGVEPVVRVFGPLGEARQISLMQRAGMTPDEIARVRFVHGNIDDVIQTVLSRP